MPSIPRDVRTRGATDRWDETVRDLVRAVGDLARLSAAATGEPLIVVHLREAAMQACRAAELALPLSRYARKP